VGKKKAVRTVEGADKTRVELRFDPEVFEGIKRLADSAQVSVNQLMQGLARWAAVRLKPNEEPTRDEDGFVTVRKQPGCLWAGRLGKFREMTDDEIEEEYGDRDLPIPKSDRLTKDLNNKGDVWVSLDFTERRVVTDLGSDG
jgi:hypothetical protein